MHRLLLIATWLLFAFSQAVAQDTDPAKTTALRLATADTSIFTTSLQLKDRLQSLWRMRAVQDAWNTPLVQAGWDEVRKKWDEHAGPFQEALKAKENQELLQLVADMASEEVFFMAGPKSPRFFGTLARALNEMQSHRFDPIFGLDGDPFSTLRDVLRLLRDEKADLVVPDLVLGFKIKDPKVAVRQIARLETILNSAAMTMPELTGKVKHQKIRGFDFGTITLDGSMVPWDHIPWDTLEGEAGEFTPLVEHLKKLKVTICLGTFEDYLVVAIGESTAVIERLGQGKKLSELADLDPLKKVQGKPIRSISYFAKSMNANSGFTRRDAEDIVKPGKELLEDTNELKDAEKKRLANDLDELAADMTKLLAHEAGSSFSVTFGTPRGEETLHYQYSRDPSVDFTKPLTLLNHAGGTPVAAWVGRAAPKPEAWDFIVKWCKKGDAIFRDIVVPKLDEDDRQRATKLLDGLYPLARRLDQTTRENIIPALADGQGGFVLDNKLKSKQWHRDMPAAKNPLPLLEPAILIGVTDAAKLQKGVSDYRAIFNDALKVIRDTVDDHAIPDDFTWPAPQVTKGNDVTVYSYTFPDELKLDGRLSPTGAVGKNVAVLAVSGEHATRVMAARPLQVGGGPLADLHRPLGSAAYFKMSALVDTALPWVDYVLELPDVHERAEKHAADIRKILTALRIFEQYTSATYLDGNVTVTHSEWVIKDAK